MASVDPNQPTNYPNMVATTVGYDGVIVILNSNLQNALKTDIGTAPADGNFAITGAIAEEIYGSGTSTAVAPTITTVGGLAHALDSAFVATTDPTQLNVHYRADSSGTQDAFAQYLMGEKGYFEDAAWTANSAGANMKGDTGNLGILTGVANDAGDAIGFTSFGIYTVNPISNLHMMDLTVGTNTVTCSATTIANDVKGTGTVATQYSASRPLAFVTNGAPSGLAESYINFCMEPQNNINFCAATGYVSIY